MRIHVLSLALLGLVVAALPARAAHVVESTTGERFEYHPQFNGIEYTCLGAGVRRLLFVKVYSVAFCMESTDLASTLAPYVPREVTDGEGQSRSLAADTRFYETLVHAPGGKMVELHMLRDVSASRLAAAFRDSLQDILPAHKIDKLVATIPRDAQRGDVVRLVSSADGDLSITVGEATRVLRDGEIASSVWRVWLGDDSVAPSLKESIARQAVRGGQNS